MFNQKQKNLTEKFLASKIFQYFMGNGTWWRKRTNGTGWEDGRTAYTNCILSDTTEIHMDLDMHNQ